MREGESHDKKKREAFVLRAPATIPDRQIEQLMNDEILIYLFVSLERPLESAPLFIHIFLVFDFSLLVLVCLKLKLHFSGVVMVRQWF